MRWVIRSIPHGALIELFLIPASAHGWCNTGHSRCYPICGMIHIKESLQLIRMSNPCSGGSWFSLSSELSFTVCPMPYNIK